MTEMDAVKRFVNEFDSFPAGLMRYKFSDRWYENWTFEGNMDYEDTDDENEVGTYGLTHEPIWNTWFVPAYGFEAGWIEEHKEKVADCGFTLIFDADDHSLFALGVDSAGYSFTDEHWLPLYRARGLRWHNTGEEA